MAGLLGISNDLMSKERLTQLMGKADELRGRFFKVLVPFTIIFCIAMYYADYIMRFLAAPLVAALPKGANALHFSNPVDVVFVNMQLAFLAALLVTTPIWVFQFWRFLSNVLGTKEKRMVMPFVAATSLLFISGTVFCYYFMLPSTLNFLIGYGMSVATPMIMMTDYVSLVVIFELSFGLVFELPVLMVVLSILGVINSTMLKKYRRLTIIIILVIAAVLTPSPDPISQLIMAVPMYLLFEAGILIIVWLEKARASEILPAVAET